MAGLGFKESRKLAGNFRVCHKERSLKIKQSSSQPLILQDLAEKGIVLGVFIRNRQASYKPESFLLCSCIKSCRDQRDEHVTYLLD